MSKAFTLTELVISFVILLLSVIILVGLSFNYLSILNSIKLRYFALNVAQAGIEYALALRNQQIEKGLSPWAGVSYKGTYCLNFNTSNRRIEVMSSSNPCPAEFHGYRRLITYTDFIDPNNTNLYNSQAIRVSSEVYFERDKIKLDVVLTRWHPTQ